ncbi:hypothetical protein CEP45_04665 [Mergibacter septicus]|nr:MlaD family protein [Mergibacter septicus]QDJ13183.1 hypothetical protein CEP45_04665 [Mergibacter septicus]
MTIPQNQENKIENQNPTIAKAKILHRKRLSSFWVLPFIALCIGAMLFYQLHQEQGKEITIYFNDGAGLVANKTQIRYQGLQIGIVKKVNFTADLKLIRVTANIYPEAVSLLREETKFWLVQPSASLAGISGLDALVSGNYITLSPGSGRDENEFVALSQGPIAEVTTGDLSLKLITETLGSVSLGAKVYYRKVPVGQVTNYRFTTDKKIEISVVIDKQYADLVRRDSHFWNTSGIQANISFSGVKVNVESLNSVIQGAIAFDSPDNSPIVENEHVFTLYPSITAAQRGIKVPIILPSDVSGLTVGETPVYYQSLQVGVLSAWKQSNELGREHLSDTQPNAELSLDPSVQFLLRDGTKIILQDRSASFSITDLEQLLQGKHFVIQAGEGKPQQQFKVIKQADLLLHQTGTLVVELRSTQAYGIEVGQPLLFNGINIGNVVDRQIKGTTIYYQVAIAKAYRHLITANTKFVAASNFSVNLGVNGMEFSATSPKTWLQGGISVISGEPTSAKPLAFYPLYKNLADAQAGIDSHNLQPTIVLHSQQLPNIQVGSVVLYRQYQVGQIIKITPNSKGFEIGVFLPPQYRRLLTTRSRFWVDKAVDINLSLQGAKVEVSPLQRVLQGAISFDQLGVATTKQIDTSLYSNKQFAQAVGQQIFLTTRDATNLQIGMPLRYLGIKVGEVMAIKLDPQKSQIKVEALLFANNFKLLARQGSRFQLVTPQISLSGVKNIESLLQPYINIELGQGNFSNHFSLEGESDTQADYKNGFPLILETANATNLSVGSPILYRGVEVGVINHIRLNSDADRVLVEIRLAKQYQHLVRQNSQFWFASGYSVDFGWRGLNIQTGTAKQLLQGGIAFATPSGEVVQPAAKPYQHFLLQLKAPTGSESWDQGSYSATSTVKPEKKE